MARDPRSAPSAPSSFTPQRIADFESWQAFRRKALGEMADALELWRGCGDKSCLRGRRCGGDGARCFTHFICALPEAERRPHPEEARKGRLDGWSSLCGSLLYHPSRRA
jgi:hypothetical protein